MNRILFLIFLLASCRATVPGTSAHDDVKSGLSPGVASISIIIVDYEDKVDYLDAIGTVKKTYGYGANTTPVNQKDTISLHISRQLYQSSELKEKEFLNCIHTGNSIKMLIKEIRRPANTSKENDYITWKAIKIN